MKRVKAWLLQRMTDWLNHEASAAGWPLCDFDRLCFEIRPADVLLIEGRSRISRVIQTVTRSVWTHSALYIGHLHDIDNIDVRDQIRAVLSPDMEHKPLLLEALLGQGVVVTPLSAYRDYHMRICRPHGLAMADVHRVVAYAVERLGMGYDVRQLFDLARFLFPYALLPRRWHSTLFEYDAGSELRIVCSTLIADAFDSVQFPILPQLDPQASGAIRIKPRNSRLFTPCDFDYSPYFDIIKYPYIADSERCLYQHLPWSDHTPRGGDTW